jgi:hypothetical protein
MAATTDMVRRYGRILRGRRCQIAVPQGHDRAATIIDTQSVKGIGVRGPRGYDAAKKVGGRKRVMTVDAEGHVLALAVVPANVQDCDTPSALAEPLGWASSRAGQTPRCRHQLPPLRGLSHGRQCPQQFSLSNRAQTGSQEFAPECVI